MGKCTNLTFILFGLCKTLIKSSANVPFQNTNTLKKIFKRSWMKNHNKSSFKLKGKQTGSNFLKISQYRNYLKVKASMRFCKNIWLKRNSKNIWFRKTKIMKEPKALKKEKMMISKDFCLKYKKPFSKTSRLHRTSFN